MLVKFAIEMPKINCTRRIDGPFLFEFCFSVYYSSADTKHLKSTKDGEVLWCVDYFSIFLLFAFIN